MFKKIIPSGIILSYILFNNHINDNINNNDNNDINKNI